MNPKTFEEEGITNAEEGFRTLFNHLPIACFGYDKDGKIIIWNRAYVDLYGFSVKEILDHTIMKNVRSSKDRLRRRETLKGVFAGKRFCGLQWRDKRANGTACFLSVDTFPLKDTDGRVIMGISTCVDITEQTRSEKALIQAAQQWRDTFDAMVDSVSILDTDHTIRRTNMATARMLGRPPKELLGTPCYELFHESQEPPENCPLRRMLESRRPEHQEFFKRNQDRWFSEGVNPIIDSHNTVSGAVHVLRDITQRKEAEKAITRERDKAQQYLDIAEVILVALDRNGEITLINRKGCHIFDYDEGELMGKNWFDVCIPAHRRDRDRTIFQKLMAGQLDSTKYNETLVLTKSGDERAIAWHNTLLRDERGHIVGTLSSGEDITDQERLKAQLLQSEKMSALGLLISGVAHELNNPLTGVLGYSQLLLGDSSIPGSSRSMIERISQEADRARKIVHNLLTFARKQKPEKREVHLNEIVERSLELRAYEMQLNTISLIKKFDPKIPPLHADEDQLQQVFLNLIINAEQAMLQAPGQNRLEVTTQWNRERNVVHITFQDDGPGIPEESLSKIFDPFYTTKPEEKGTGLGLSISYGIVKEHGGCITVASKEGCGAAFTVELPCPEQIHRSEQHRPVEATKKNILVVDDETSIVNLVRMALEMRGHFVETATDGESALRKLEERPFDAIITDIKMPGKNGIDIVQYCQETKPDVAKRILIITGDVVDPETMRLMKEQNLPFLPKPFDTEELISSVSRLFQDSC
jgi:PAS domain S-box-containing protein